MLSFVTGPSKPVLLELSIPALLKLQASRHPERDAIVCSWTGVRWTYRGLHERSRQVARGLVALGIQPGDRVGILSGNCERYVELSFAVSLIGAIVVVLNTTYTPIECVRAVKHSGCRVLFTSTSIGRRSMQSHLDLLAEMAQDGDSALSYLKHVVLIRHDQQPATDAMLSYDEFILKGDDISSAIVDKLESSVDVYDICNFQYTSGTTGAPKATMLTHHNIVNNGFFIGERMALTEVDRICCPPPLFHCFGLVLGLLACISHGAALVLPGQTFEAKSVLDALVAEKCTGLHGVPTMFVAELEHLRSLPVAPTIRLRTGIAAGSPVSRALMEHLQQAFGFPELCITFGMTETSPASFMTSVEDGVSEKLSTVGKILPHTSAKVVDTHGQVVPRGVPGELWVSGYNVQVGYFNEPHKTRDTVVKDDAGTVWIKTGDEVFLDENGYCHITGRIKDVIIRGGENIYPLEIEERLAQHAGVAQAAVVGLKDRKYGEVPAAFLEPHVKGASTARPTDSELQDWVGAVLGHHKVPVHIFWLGDSGVGDSFPVTGSGKLKKNELRETGNMLVETAVVAVP